MSSWVKHALKFHYWIIEISFVLISLNGLAVDSHKLLISEILAVNGSILKDNDGNFSDWIEIYNPGIDAIDLSGWALTDNHENPGKWKFPAMTLAGGGYIMVFASEKNRSQSGEELHTNFKLSGSGEYLALMEPDLITTDGTRPDKNTGILYTRPVEITTTTPLSAIIYQNDQACSAIVSHTYLFINDIIRQPNNPGGYPSEWGPFALSAGNAPADYEMDPEVCNHPAYKDLIY